MRNNLVVPLAAIVLACSTAVFAQDHMGQMNHMDHQKHMASMNEDARQLVNFPPEMRQHTLANMRDHLQALSEILAAMSGAQYAKAGQIADTRLSMNSPSAEGCKGEATANGPQMSKPANMDHQMSQFMPEGMRNIGLEMHQAASNFSIEAKKAAKTNNAKPALAALSKVTQQCSACHSAYKVQ
jgi:cytochrome c556